MGDRIGVLGCVIWFSIGGGFISASAQASQSCAPFFDNLNNPVLTKVFDESTHKFVKTNGDMTPDAPRVDNLDEAFLSVCGAWGDQVSAGAIRSLLDRFPDQLIHPLKDLLPAGATQAREKLVSIWTAKRAFEHIFCGQPKTKKIGGLHFGARYLQLQKQGTICRKMANSSDELLEGRVYTVGITSAKGSDDKKGYALGEQAADIFYEASWVFLRHCSSGNNSNFGCLARSATEPTVLNKFFCAQGKGVITRYSVASGEIMSDRKCDKVPRM